MSWNKLRKKRWLNNKIKYAIKCNNNDAKLKSNGKNQNGGDQRAKKGMFNTHFTVCIMHIVHLHIHALCLLYVFWLFPSQCHFSRLSIFAVRFSLFSICSNECSQANCTIVVHFIALSKEISCVPVFTLTYH